MWEHSHSLYPGWSIHSRAHRDRDNKTVLWHCTCLFFSSLILVGNHAGGSRPGLQTMAGGHTCSLPPVVVSVSGHSHTYYTLTDHGWFHAVTAEASSCGRNCRAPKSQGIGLLQNKFVNSYPKDWRRQSSYLQSLQPHGVDRLINDQVGYEKNKITTKRPIRKFLQNSSSAWERLKCEPTFDIKGFL